MSVEQPQEQPAQFVTDGLTPEQDQYLVELLLKWNGGRISTPVFTQLARITPQAIVEVVLFRKNKVLETLLIPRPDDDIVWPGMFHTPGVALRTSDYYREDQNPLKGAFKRIEEEINNEFASPPTFAGRLDRLSERGPEVVEVYTAELPESMNLKPGQVWFPVEQLPNNEKFIHGQMGHVNIAADAYLRKRV